MQGDIVGILTDVVFPAAHLLNAQTHLIAIKINTAYAAEARRNVTVAGNLYDVSAACCNVSSIINVCDRRRISPDDIRRFDKSVCIAVVLCGGISNAGDLIIKPAKEQIKKRAFKTAAKACKIVVSKYTSKLGVVGAAMLVKN